MNKLCLITGASSGIGRELAHVHAEQGGDLIIVARRRLELEELKKELETKHKIKVIPIVKDLTEKGASQWIYDFLVAEKLVVEILVNNAGFGGIGKFHERPWSRDEAMIDLNVKALVELSRLFLPDFVRNKKGKILNVASIAGLIPGPHQAVYFASKSFVISFGLALSEELRGTGVSVTTLCPGPTDSEFAKISEMDKTKMFKNSFSSRSVAEKAYKALMRDKIIVYAAIPLWQKLFLPARHLVPTKLLLRAVGKMQDTK